MAPPAARWPHLPARDWRPQQLQAKQGEQMIEIIIIIISCPLSLSLSCVRVVPFQLPIWMSETDGLWTQIQLRQPIQRTGNHLATHKVH